MAGSNKIVTTSDFIKVNKTVKLPKMFFNLLFKTTEAHKEMLLHKGNTLIIPSPGGTPITKGISCSITKLLLLMSPHY